MRIILIICAVLITSCFYFPFEFTFLKGLNTKLMLAAVGVPIMGYHFIKMRGILLSKEVGIASMIAILFSLIGFISLDYNNANDYSYASYIVSMWVWFSASYAVCTIIALLHNYINPRIVINYLIAVCVFQCVMALSIEFVPSVKRIVDAYFMTGDIVFMEKVNRLYGIGALLDVAGIRFSSVLVMISVLLSNDHEVKKDRVLIYFYAISFLIIAVVGNMISRTTSIGMAIALFYLFYSTGIISFSIRAKNFRLWRVLLSATAIGLVLVSYFYQTNRNVYKLFRFAFEGFFKWVETGKWETDSTNTLQSMWVYPDNLKTWIIGDGYFNDPITHGFYMQTDVGYLRFIFYCGLIGLTVFMLYFVYLSTTLWFRFNYIKQLFFMLFILVVLNWIKVSTDIFLVYAVFLSISSPYFVKHYYQEPRPTT
ncbi:hypothetical protein LZQ00_17270 [Sphingobacterium sp. SRCM116780]|uniref:hypothetical protein n=1 Tax=Sphingobacterium sp. SRCM116780 TaxID=2907623 RepID=UPI001F312B93|nr:hypothetical protein [Sphingobacterium sp. SRCM116780]UIR56001.1 hypothetical protein LZQ00_17270 [Sphingobacterium sp. SRCM116780]